MAKAVNDARENRQKYLLEFEAAVEDLDLEHIQSL